MKKKLLLFATALFASIILVVACTPAPPVAPDYISNPPADSATLVTNLESDDWTIIVNLENAGYGRMIMAMRVKIDGVLIDIDDDDFDPDDLDRTATAVLEMVVISYYDTEAMAIAAEEEMAEIKDELQKDLDDGEITATMTWGFWRNSKIFSMWVHASGTVAQVMEADIFF